MEETEIKRKPTELYQEYPGGPLKQGNPGRPPETEEQKEIKKARKERVEEYKDALAEALPNLSPILIAAALRSEAWAVKELNDILIDKAPRNFDMTSGGEKIIPILGGITNVISKDDSSK